MTEPSEPAITQPGAAAYGTSAADLQAALTALRAHDVPTHGGRTLAYVYDSGLESADQVGRDALAAYGATNGLDPTAFPSLLQMENDLVALAGTLLDAPAGYAGVATSGGTESVLLAVLAARDAHPEVERPQLLLPTTAHAAFHKAAHLFGLEAVMVPVDPQTKRADVAATAALITDRTVLIVGSAPSYAHGVIDPIPELAALASEHGVRCHVDACIGGWVLPFLRDEGGPAWTFAVPGVTSISVDLHKYGYTPKGISLLLHRDVALRHGHFFGSAQWPGYTMLNTTLQSTKSGGPLAAGWAVTRHIGLDRYADLARRARAATLAVAAAVDTIDGLSVAAPPDSTLLSLVADHSCDVFTLSDLLREKGWLTQPQMSFGDLPATLHLSFSAATAESSDALIADLAAAVSVAQEQGPVEVPAPLLALLSSLTPAAISASLDDLMAAAGLAGSAGDVTLPESMAPLNALLDRLPPGHREAVLLGVMERLFRPSA